MVNLDKFWETLELNADRSAITHYWNAALREALEILKIFLRPTEERVEFYPNPIYPECHPYYCLSEKN